MDAKSDLDRKTEVAALIKDGTHGKEMTGQKWCEISRYMHYSNFRYFREYSVYTIFPKISKITIVHISTNFAPFLSSHFFPMGSVLNESSHLGLAVKVRLGIQK